MSPLSHMQKQGATDFLHALGLYGERAVAGQEAGGALMLPLPPRLPLLDVRSPAEYARGHIPGAVNLPLFSDAERAQVGALYKSQGRDAAVLHGLALSGPRLAALAREAFALAGPGRELALYCSRGGMRSASFAWLCSLAGLRARVLQGGYKAFRRHVLHVLQKPQPLWVLGGKTGAGKTEALHRLAAMGARVIDLEGLARHRGSAFGAHADAEQPSCGHLENCLAVALGQCGPAHPVWVEDECENLGTVNLPQVFFRQLRASPLVALEAPEQARLARVLDEYGGIPAKRMGECLDRIKKRLGGLAHKQAQACLAAGDLAGLARILLDYYDRAYAKQLVNRPPVTVVQAAGPDEAVRALLAAVRAVPPLGRARGSGPLVCAVIPRRGCR